MNHPSKLAFLQVHVVELKLGKEEAAGRYAAAMASAAAGLEVAGVNQQGGHLPAEVGALKHQTELTHCA